MIYLARDWHLGHLVPAGAADLYARFLYSHSPREVHRLTRTQSPSFRQVLSALEYLTVPGMALHYAVRKLAIEDFVRAGIKAGKQQVVVLAAGFDTLAQRLHQEFSQVRF
ncbi:MAG TPA: class I SAM-dependent methyltransferase, partial [Burkholderiaceae bacterium]|nr:class I SAM-dependent methyltransferase [Burkholderiaceae bacterium]